MRPWSTEVEQVVIDEHGTVEGVLISPKTVAALSRYEMEVVEEGRKVKKRPLQLTPTGVRDHYTLHANSIVGSFSAGSIEVNILPKAGVGRTAEILAYGAGLSTWQAEWSRFDKAPTFAQALAPMFLSQVEMLVGGGLVEDYVRVSERGAAPKGRIAFDLLARQGIPLPVDYSYDEFTVDTPPNRMLRRALHEVTDLHGASTAVHATARELLGYFVDVRFDHWAVAADTDFLPPRLAHYRSALQLAYLIVSRLGLEPTSGTRRAQGLLFDMNSVFEAFVSALVDRSRPPWLTLDLQGRTRALYLDRAKALRLHPDFSLWSGGQCALVGDAKYKVIDASQGPRRSDLYQIASYASSARTSLALLIYVGSRTARDIQLEHPDVVVTALPLDLGQPISLLEQSLSHRLARIAGSAALPPLRDRALTKTAALGP